MQAGNVAPAKRKQIMKSLNKIATEKMNHMIFSDGTIATHKMSSFYHARKTTYASCLNESPFIIITDKALIVAAGFSARCKAIITLDNTHPAVIMRVTEVKEANDNRITAMNKAEEEKAKHITDLAWKVSVEIHLIDFLTSEMFENRKANNQILNKAVGIVGYDYAKYCGWNVVVTEIQNQLTF